MILKNQILIIISVVIISISKCLGQETPKQLGVMFFDSLKSENFTGLNNIIPKPEILIKYAKSNGLVISEEEIDKFLKAYPEEVKIFVERLNQLKLDAEKLGIDWNLAEFRNINTKISKQKFREKDKPIDITNLNVIFNCKNKSYKLILNSIFKHNKLWYLAGNRQSVEEIKS